MGSEDISFESYDEGYKSSSCKSTDTFQGARGIAPRL